MKGLDEVFLCFVFLVWFDIEFEMGVIVGCGLEGLVSVVVVDVMIFGYVLLNDWLVWDI